MEFLAALGGESKLLDTFNFWAVGFLTVSENICEENALQITIERFLESAKIPARWK